MFSHPLVGVCRHLVILNVIFFIGSYILLGSESVDLINNEIDLGRYQLAAFLPGSQHFQPYQIFTHMFMHAGVGHIFFNMISLYFFGPWVESHMGPKRFLTYYLLCGLGAYLLFTAIQYIQITNAGIDPHYFNGSMLGASGAIFGIYAAYGVFYAEREIYLLFPPIPLKAKYFVLIFVLLDLFSGIKGSGSGVAHFAHVGGAVSGLLLILFWYGGFNKKGKGW